MTIWWQQLVLVMLGGALGAAARHWLGGALLRHSPDPEVSARAFVTALEKAVKERKP